MRLPQLLHSRQQLRGHTQSRLPQTGVHLQVGQHRTGGRQDRSGGRGHQGCQLLRQVRAGGGGDRGGCRRQARGVVPGRGLHGGRGHSGRVPSGHRGGGVEDQGLGTSEP